MSFATAQRGAPRLDSHRRPAQSFASNRNQDVYSLAIAPTEPPDDEPSETDSSNDDSNEDDGAIVRRSVRAVHINDDQLFADDMSRSSIFDALLGEARVLRSTGHQFLSQHRETIPSLKMVTQDALVILNCHARYTQCPVSYVRYQGAGSTALRQMTDHKFRKGSYSLHPSKWDANQKMLSRQFILYRSSILNPSRNFRRAQDSTIKGDLYWMGVLFYLLSNFNAEARARRWTQPAVPEDGRFLLQELCDVTYLTTQADQQRPDERLRCVPLQVIFEYMFEYMRYNRQVRPGTAGKFFCFIINLAHVVLQPRGYTYVWIEPTVGCLGHPTKLRCDPATAKAHFVTIQLTLEHMADQLDSYDQILTLNRAAPTESLSFYSFQWTRQRLRLAYTELLSEALDCMELQYSKEMSLGLQLTKIISCHNDDPGKALTWTPKMAAYMQSLRGVDATKQDKRRGLLCWTLLRWHYKYVLICFLTTMVPMRVSVLPTLCWGSELYAVESVPSKLTYRLKIHSFNETVRGAEQMYKATNRTKRGLYTGPMNFKVPDMMTDLLLIIDPSKDKVMNLFWQKSGFSKKVVAESNPSVFFYMAPMPGVSQTRTLGAKPMTANQFRTWNRSTQSAFGSEHRCLTVLNIRNAYVTMIRGIGESSDRVAQRQYKQARETFAKYLLEKVKDTGGLQAIYVETANTMMNSVLTQAKTYNNDPMGEGKMDYYQDGLELFCSTFDNVPVPPSCVACGCHATDTELWGGKHRLQRAVNPVFMRGMHTKCVCVQLVSNTHPVGDLYDWGASYDISALLLWSNYLQSTIHWRDTQYIPPQTVFEWKGLMKAISNFAIHESSLRDIVAQPTLKSAAKFVQSQMNEEARQVVQQLCSQFMDDVGQSNEYSDEFLTPAEPRGQGNAVLNQYTKEKSMKKVDGKIQNTTDRMRNDQDQFKWPTDIFDSYIKLWNDDPIIGDGVVSGSDMDDDDDDNNDDEKRPANGVDDGKTQYDKDDDQKGSDEDGSSDDVNLTKSVKSKKQHHRSNANYTTRRARPRPEVIIDMMFVCQDDVQYLYSHSTSAHMNIEHGQKLFNTHYRADVKGSAKKGIVQSQSNCTGVLELVTPQQPRKPYYQMTSISTWIHWAAFQRNDTTQKMTLNMKIIDDELVSYFVLTFDVIAVLGEFVMADTQPVEKNRLCPNESITHTLWARKEWYIVQMKLKTTDIPNPWREHPTPHIILPKSVVNARKSANKSWVTELNNFYLCQKLIVEPNEAFKTITLRKQVMRHDLQQSGVIKLRRSTRVFNKQQQKDNSQSVINPKPLSSYP
jgi:hypothetical protein